MDEKIKLCKNPLISSINRNTEKYSFLNTTFKFQLGLLKNNYFLQNIPEKLFFKLYQYFHFKDNWIENKISSYKLYKTCDNEITVDKSGFKKNTKKIYYAQEDFEKNTKTNNDIMNYNKNSPINLRLSIYKETDVTYENISSKNDKDIIYAIPSDSNYTVYDVNDITLSYNDMLSLVFRNYKDSTGTEVYSLFLIVKILPNKLDSNIDTLNACLNIPSPLLLYTFLNEFNLVIDTKFKTITREIINNISNKADAISIELVENNVNDDNKLFVYNFIKEYQFLYIPKTQYILGFLGYNDKKDTRDNGSYHHKQQNGTNQRFNNNYKQQNGTNQRFNNNYKQQNGTNQRNNNYKQQNGTNQRFTPNHKQYSTNQRFNNSHHKQYDGTNQKTNNSNYHNKPYNRSKKDNLFEKYGIVKDI